MFNNEFITDISNVVVIITERNHPRFGQIARLKAHDWLEIGLLYVEYIDKSEDELPENKVELYLRTRNVVNINRWLDFAKGPDNFVEKYLSLNGDSIKRLREEYKKLFFTDLDKEVQIK